MGEGVKRERRGERVGYGEEEGEGERYRQLDSCLGRSSTEAAAPFEVYLIATTRGAGEGYPACKGTCVYVCVLVCECVCPCVLLIMTLHAVLVFASCQRICLRGLWPKLS